MEYTTNRTDQLDVFRVALPIPEESLQIGILFIELFKEDLTDFVIDAFGGVIETIDDIAGFIDHNDRIVGLHGCRDCSSLSGSRNCGRNLGGGRHIALGGARGLLGYRPVMQCFKALAGDVENAIAVWSTVAHGLEVVLEARKHFGQTLHLIAVGNAFAIDQFDARVCVYPVNVSRHGGVFKNGEGAGNLFQQARDYRELLMIPIAFNECDVCLPHLHEVDNGFADECVQQLMRLR